MSTMAKTKDELNQILSYESDIYKKMIPSSLGGRICAWIKNVQILSLYSWIVSSRKMDYYKYKKEISSNPLYSILYLYYARKTNKLCQKLNMEMNTLGPDGLLQHHCPENNLKTSIQNSWQTTPTLKSSPSLLAMP